MGTSVGQNYLCEVQIMDQSVTKRAPFTFGQLSLWRSIQGLSPQACNLPQIWMLPAGTTVASAERALEALEERHESLRTRYEPEGEHGLTQVAWEPGAVRLDEVEAGGEPARVAEEAAERLAIDPFDLAVDRPWRACVVSSAGTPSRLIICFHHIAADAWAINHLNEEFLALLDDRLLLDTPPNSRDLATEQWSAARQKRRLAARAYWQQIFQAAPAMEKESWRGTPSTRWARLGSEAIADAASRIAVRLQVSLPSVVLAAFCLALGRRTGRDHLLIAVYANNRSNPRWETLVATQTQIVPLLVTLDPEEEFDALVLRLQGEILRSYRHGSYNVDDIVELGRQYGYSGSVNGSFEGSVSGFFRYFFNYLGQYQQEQTPTEEEIETGTAGRNIGAPLYLQVQDGKGLTCTLRENSAAAGFDGVTGPLLLIRDIILTAAETE
jgi:hypothetical protein